MEQWQVFVSTLTGILGLCFTILKIGTSGKNANSSDSNKTKFRTIPENEWSELCTELAVLQERFSEHSKRNDEFKTETRRKFDEYVKRFEEINRDGDRWVSDIRDIFNEILKQNPAKG